MSVGDLLVGFYLLLVVAFLAWQWARSPAIEEPELRSIAAEEAEEPAEQEARKAA